MSNLYYGLQLSTIDTLVTNEKKRRKYSIKDEKDDTCT